MKALPVLHGTDRVPCSEGPRERGQDKSPRFCLSRDDPLRKEADISAQLNRDL